MEIRTEQGGSHAIKVIESLKKHLFDTNESGRYSIMCIVLAQLVLSLTLTRNYAVARL